MGRKRNQGKARRAAKAAKAREEEAQESRGSGSQMMEAVLSCAEGIKCVHGAGPLTLENSGSLLFLYAFGEELDKAIERSTDATSSLAEARSATRVQFAEVWKDSTKIKIAIALFLMLGTHNLLGGKYDTARGLAICARYLQQYISVELHQTQALYNWPKIEDTYFADDHTLVKFFRHRIPCSCLEEKYQEVKHITKLGRCWFTHCSVPGRILERSKTMYCSRCRNITYCSLECQKADWSRHKPYCDKCTDMIAKFEVKQQE